MKHSTKHSLSSANKVINLTITSRAATQKTTTKANRAATDVGLDLFEVCDLIDVNAQFPLLDNCKTNDFIDITAQLFEQLRIETKMDGDVCAKNPRM